jgi:hypothetical protein
MSALLWRQLENLIEGSSGFERAGSLEKLKLEVDVCTQLATQSGVFLKDRALHVRSDIYPCAFHVIK